MGFDIVSSGPMPAAILIGGPLLIIVALVIVGLVRRKRDGPEL